MMIVQNVGNQCGTVSVLRQLQGRLTSHNCRIFFQSDPN